MLESVFKNEMQQCNAVVLSFSFKFGSTLVSLMVLALVLA